MRIKVTIVDDDEGVQDSIKVVLASASHFDCVGSYLNAVEALRFIPGTRPDIVLMDIRMPEMSGIECTHKLKVILPDLPILMHTGCTDTQSFLRSLMAGCDGYLVKGDSPSELPEALRELHKGGTPFSDAVLHKLKSCFRRLPKIDPGNRSLSLCEEEVLAYLFQDYRHKQIADSLGVGLKTIRTHVYHIERKLSAHNRSGIIGKFLGLQ